MSGLLERAAAVFVAPAGAAAPVARSFAPRALVLGSARAAIPLASALAGGLRERERAACALLITWPVADAPRPALGTPAASRLVAGLEARGLGAAARGRLAWLPLADLALAARALAAVDVPVVIVITGARTAATDALLAEQDQIVLVTEPGEDPRLAELVARDFAERDIPLTVRGPLSTPGARATALAGWGRLRLPA